MKTKLFIILTALCTIANAQYTKLLDFAGISNGSAPFSSLISDGTFLYGMTYFGDTNGLGLVFKIMPDGTNYTKLLDFAGVSNGSNPKGSLISDGTFLYGMTFYGDTNGLGLVFKIMPDGTNYTKLVDFASVSNGRNPYGSLISDGTFLYGMTYGGGTNDMGVVFKIMPDGTNYTKLLDFAGISNGSNPKGSLISDGTFLYGMTYFGGTNDMGVIFKIMPDGTNYTKLLDFAGASNGRNPYGSLISDGTFLYGMTYGGGTNDIGVIFKIMPDGTNYTKLLDFAGTANGSYPYGDLISDGTFLYGMTYSGGTNDMGVIFKIMPDGTNYTKMLDLAGASNGSYPYGSLITDGTFLYGMTYGGGINGLGTIFKYCIAPVTFTQSPTLCVGQSITVGSNTYTASGTYTDTFTTVNDCDSVITTNLTVLAPITNSFSITFPTCGNNNGSVSANPLGGATTYTYLWSNGNTTSIVTGLTGQPADTLFITITDSLGCTLVDTIIVNCVMGIDENSAEDTFSIYPNPFPIQTTLLTNHLVKNATFTIYNSFGQKVKQMTNISGQTVIFHRDNLSNGLYFIRLTQDSKVVTTKKLLITD